MNGVRLISSFSLPQYNYYIKDETLVAGRFDLCSYALLCKPYIYVHDCNVAINVYCYFLFIHKLFYVCGNYEYMCANYECMCAFLIHIMILPRIAGNTLHSSCCLHYETKIILYILTNDLQNVL